MSASGLFSSGQLRDAFAQALFALREHRTRTVLSILGIAVGIIAVIVVGVVTKGVRERVFTEIESYGMQSFWIYRNTKTAGPEAAVRSGTGMDNDDLEAVRLGCCPAVLHVSPRVYFDDWSVNVRAGNQYARVLLEGVDTPFLEISRDEIQYGRYLRPADIEFRRPVAVIGTKVQQDLFPGQSNPVGESFRFNEQKLTVVGVLREKNRDFLKSIGAAENFDINEHVLIPYTLHQQLLVSKDVHTLAGEAVNARSMKEASTQIIDLLHRHHNNKYEYTAETMEAWVATADQILGGISLVGVIAASVSLLVGGIGIMNIMTTSVVERTREIGIRKAIGAHPRDILMQFLLEAVFISTLGGVFGLLLGLGASYGLASWTQLDVVPSIWIQLVALLVSMAVGIASGYYPARRAAALKPVDALRYE